VGLATPETSLAALDDGVRLLGSCNRPWLEMHMTDTVEARLAALGLTLPSAPAPVANYVPFVLAHNFLYIAGQIPRGPSGIVYAGKVGADVSIEDGQKAAQLCCLNILAQVKAALGDFGRVAQCVRLNGFVNAGPDFSDHPTVINGASDLMVALFGDRGRHTRAAVGVASLPANSAVEVDAIFAIG
jgi:enamine deaminase RidA (YjgF/YER057c/UK114 family)